MIAPFSILQRNTFLTINNKEYRSILDELFLFLTKNDHGGYDATIKVFLSDALSSAKKEGVIVSKSECIVAGVEEIEYLVKNHTRLTLEPYVSDGEMVAYGKKLLALRGKASEILQYERAILNILQRMSGIATETARYVDTIKDLRLKNSPVIAATRKTPWMHVDKKAVAVGGGVTHRLNLRDGILLKDNHLELIKEEQSLKNESEAVAHAIEYAEISDEDIAIEIEVKTDEGVFSAIEAIQKRNLKNPFIIMLDNFGHERISEMLKQVLPDKKRKVFFEASGGINLENIEAFAKTGVHVISIGALTHSPKAADLSLDLLS